VLPALRVPLAMVLASRDGSRVFTAVARVPVARPTMKAVVLRSIARAIRPCRPGAPERVPSRQLERFPRSDHWSLLPDPWHDQAPGFLSHGADQEQYSSWRLRTRSGVLGRLGPVDDAVDRGAADAVFLDEIGQGHLAFGVAAPDGARGRGRKLGLFAE
jgi:hypothetical protein